jgi:hypothetical protein
MAVAAVAWILASNPLELEVPYIPYYRYQNRCLPLGADGIIRARISSLTVISETLEG